MSDPDCTNATMVSFGQYDQVRKERDALQALVCRKRETEQFSIDDDAIDQSVGTGDVFDLRSQVRSLTAERDAAWEDNDILRRMLDTAEFNIKELIAERGAALADVAKLETAHGQNMRELDKLRAQLAGYVELFGGEPSWKSCLKMLEDCQEERNVALAKLAKAREVIGAARWRLVDDGVLYSDPLIARIDALVKELGGVE